MREALAEAVLCLARVDAARKQLWKVDAPTLLQKGCAQAVQVGGARRCMDALSSCSARLAA